MWMPATILSASSIPMRLTLSSARPSDGRDGKAAADIRHGETDWNVAGRLQGRHDVPLNARGRLQARHCGDILRSLLALTGRVPADFDYISSPLGRARETMQLVRGPLGLPPNGYRVDERLSEIAFGDWEGFTIAQLHMR